jgi:hypothetical protein
LLLLGKLLNPITVVLVCHPAAALLMHYHSVVWKTSVGLALAKWRNIPATRLSLKARLPFCLMWFTSAWMPAELVHNLHQFLVRRKVAVEKYLAIERIINNIPKFKRDAEHKTFNSRATEGIINLIS